MEQLSFAAEDFLHPTRIFWKIRHNIVYSKIGVLSPFGVDKSLDLGSGKTPRNPFGAKTSFGLDIAGNSKSNVFGVDLALEAIPFDEGFFDVVTAYDFIEHVPRVSLHQGRSIFPFIALMNEIYRVLRPGGVFLSVTPAYPSAEAFQDPTHVNIITKETFPRYFCEDRWAAMYGFSGAFTLLHQSRLKSHLHTLMRKG